MRRDDVRVESLPFSIHPATTMGPVHLTTNDVSRLAAFYGRVLGLQPVQTDQQRTWLGTGDGSPLLVLIQAEDAKPKRLQAAGLYHVALLMPTRRDLACFLRHLNQIAFPLHGASDHGASEALYLSDPDGNGLEVYADRQRSAWHHADGTLALTTVPLNVDDLLRTADGDESIWTGLPQGTCVGHVHLHVVDLAQAEAFYCDVLGFTRMARYGPSASFVSAGGYHHHIGMNTWAGRTEPTQVGATGLHHFTVRLPDEAARDAVEVQVKWAGIDFTWENDELVLYDPAHNQIRFTL